MEMELPNPASANLRILTIGHSDHPLDHFLSLLKLHSADVVVDTRSYPYSNFAPQYDRQALRKALVEIGLRYVYMGRELGGRPQGDQYYDPEGHVLYGKVADSELFRAGLSRLEVGIRKHNVALLCAEENPTGCHRRLLIARVLLGDGIEVDHIRGDGRLQPESELSREVSASAPQMNLFRETEASEWKSIPSVLRKKRQSSSSAS
jgi:uncharacterized protein (DUF488 family)